MRSAEKSLAYFRAYREKNSAQINARTRAWRQQNIDRERARSRDGAAAYASKHPDRIAERNQRFYAENTEAQLERSKAWAKANPEKWAKANPEKVKTKKRRGALRAYLTNLRLKHGLSEADYCALLGEQNGLCAICGMTNDGIALHVDHKHVTGYETLPPMLRAMHVRGLLCVRCNTGLGAFKDNPELLRRAMEYLDV